MSTRSTIAVKHRNGAVEKIYCHNDGYIYRGVGTKLYYNYSQESDVIELVYLGGISSLGENINDTFAYHRDAGDALVINTYHSYDEYIKSDMEECNYLFDCSTSTWFVDGEPLPNYFNYRSY